MEEFRGDRVTILRKILRLKKKNQKTFSFFRNPTPEPSEDLNNVIWTPYTNEKPTYVDIGEKITSVDGLYFEDRIALWETLFPIEERKKNYAKKSKRSKKSKKVKMCKKYRPKY